MYQMYQLGADHAARFLAYRRVLDRLLGPTPRDDKEGALFYYRARRAELDAEAQIEEMARRFASASAAAGALTLGIEMSGHYIAPDGPVVPHGRRALRGLYESSAGALGAAFALPKKPEDEPGAEALRHLCLSWLGPFLSAGAGGAAYEPEALRLAQLREVARIFSVAAETAHAIIALGTIGDVRRERRTNRPDRPLMWLVQQAQRLELTVRDLAKMLRGLPGWCLPEGTIAKRLAEYWKRCAAMPPIDL